MPKKLSAETDVIEIGDTGGGVVGTIIVHVVGSAWTGSLTVKGRHREAGAAGVAYQPIPYRRRSLGGTASDDTTVSDAITGDAIIAIDAAGLDVALDHTHTSGSVALYYEPLKG